MARKRNWDPNRKSGRRRQSHFMDAAMDGYVRDLALRCWREVDDRAEATEGGTQGVLAEIGTHLAAGPYGELWSAAWQRHLGAGDGGGETHLLGRIEAAVREALQAEHVARRERGDETIEDTPGYKEFVNRAMNRLLEEASGEIEEMD